MTTPDRFVSGAIDLGEVKARAEVRAQQSAASSSTVASVVTVTAENFEDEVVRRSLQVPVVVLVGSSRSEQSEQLRADFTTLAAQAELQWIFAYVDADTSPEIAQAFGITGLPTVIALADGRPLADFQGGQPMDALQQWTAAVVGAVAGKLAGIAADNEESGPTDPRFDAATDALNAGDFDAAIAVYDDILAHEPANAEAKSARFNALFLSRLATSQATGDVIAAANADPSDVEKQFVAADAEIAAGDVESAFQRLLSALPRDKERVRQRLLELFALFEPTDPRVVTARGQMASALF